MTDGKLAVRRVIHLKYGEKAICGRWSKFLTLTASQVTCPDCRETWDCSKAENEAIVKAITGKGASGG